MNDIEQIIRINGYIQHQGPLTYGGKEINCVALDHSCVFKDNEEVILDEQQLAEIYRQTFFPPNMQPWTCQHCQSSQRWVAVRKMVWLVDKPNEALTICAACHKQLYRENKIAKEAL